MPIFRIGDKLHYYAHVPKCGGSSVEAYLKSRFGSLAFLNTRYLDLPEHARWTRSSPQHAAFDDLTRLIPPDWIASSFAVVRHPVKRLVSAFQFQVEVEGTVAALWSIDEFFDDWLNRAGAEPFHYDNHLRPQSDIVPEGATIFRLEDGMAPLVSHLDSLAGNTDGPRAIPKENVRKKGMAPDAERLNPSAETMARIASYYAEDFRRFGYSPDDTTQPAIQPAAPKGLMGRLAGALSGGRT
ncbi:sulfotransferase family protein [Defluviimonas sp. WL0050]|uniref:Sulfotransferase family protein n=1 Tax=Albidovulum litorale TaxID=2984134 RepID=A0ABT2ZKC4_9RHOB|nr:sulfotransferase family protein [Defluviimonas sp. WL0050]MCV2871573.1 sulfotransferase family protein [Defluviimonas sp. WL0050]